MRILVTGRDGQVARSLAECSAGHRLVFAARPDLDLGDPASIERIVAAVSPDLIISAAAYTAVDKAEDDAEIAMAVNGDGPGALAGAAARIGAPVIHLSTDYVHSGSLERPWREDDPVSPLSVYGATKLAGEQAVAASGATYAILRTAWVYSPFGNNFVKTMLRLAGTHDSLNVVDDQLGCPTSAFEIANALATVVANWHADASRGVNAVYNFAGAGETSWAGFACAIFEESVKRNGPTAKIKGIPSCAYPTRAVRPANSRLDCTRFTETFHYSAPEWRVSLRSIMDRLCPQGTGLHPR